MIGWLVGGLAVREIHGLVGCIGKGGLWEITVDERGRVWLEDFKSGRLSQHTTIEKAEKAARKIK